MTGSTLSVLSAPLLDPGMARQRLNVPFGLSVAEVVARVAPRRQPAAGHLRVLLSTESGVEVLEERYWGQVRPKQGTRIIIRAVPGKDALRSVLLAVVAVGASVFAPGLASVLLPGLSPTLGAAIIGTGISVIGSLLINALIPIETPDALERRNVYKIDGWRNDLRPGAPVPLPLGKHRYAPPFAAQSYTEIVGDQQYIRALFCLGYGPIRISDLRIGETSIGDYEDIETEIREGRPDDTAVSLYPEQVLEEGAGVQLVRPRPRDLNGNIISDAPSEETPVIRFTASNSARASVILGFPAGLFTIDDKGRRRARTVVVRIRARLNGTGVWSDVVTLNVSAETQESFFRQHSWTLPSRGRWQIEITRMSEDSDSTQASDKAVLAAIQSIRPEYPINLDKPLALIAVRVRATYQLNGSLDSFNCLLEHQGPVREGGEWVQGYSRNPATAFLSALMGPHNPYPVVETEIDMEQIADWYDWCAAKGLKYDRVHDAPEGLGDMLNAISGAGRASPRHDGVEWGVVIDRPQTLVIDHINPRNSDQFEWSRDYFIPPDALRVRFLDETNNYEEAERIVRWPGHEGPVVLTESIDLPGKTDPDEIYVEALRRMYELQYRADNFAAMQSGTARVVTRGDLVMGSFDVLSRTQMAARVKSVQGQLVEIDEEVTVGAEYGVRFKAYEDAEDLYGTSLVRPIAENASPSRALLLSGTGDLPEMGEILHIGPMITQSLALRVRGVEAAEDFQSRILMVAAAPEIDDLVDAAEIPAWDGRVGAEVDLADVIPAVPVFVSIASGVVGTGDPDGLQLILRPGTGSTAALTAFELDHRLQGASTWTTVIIPVASAGASLDVYSATDQVELRARALASTTPGEYTGVASITIGAEDPDVPEALASDAVMVMGLLGYAAITISVSATDAPSQIQIYRVPAGDPLDRDTHAVGSPVLVAAGSTVSYTDGDGTRFNLISNGTFATSADWTEGDGWAIAGGRAEHTPGAAGPLSQALTLEAGTSYRVAFTVSEYLAGSVTPSLSGGTTASGSAVIADGLVLDRITALSGNTEFALDAASDFDGAIEDLVLFRESVTSVPAGQWDYYFEPQNSEDIAARLSS